MKIFKETIGQGEEVAILHGWGIDHRYMQPIVNFLKSRFHITNVDLPGRGQSEWPSSIHTIHDIADLLLPYLPKKAIYIGWSFGGLVSMSIAARYPERIKKLIGIATTPKFLEDDTWAGNAKPGFYAAVLEVEKIGAKKFFHGVFEKEFADFDPKPPLYHELLEIDNLLDYDLEIFAKGVHIADTTDLRKEFRSIQCPIDLIFGEFDPCIPLQAVAAMQKLNPNIHTHVIPHAKHFLFWTHPQEVNHLLNTIFNSLTG